MSNEWLTTGQMLDKLQVGEIAELEKKAQIPLKFGPSYKHVTKNNDGDIRWCTKEGESDQLCPVVLYGHTVNWKWRIIPNYVSFEEAMKALKEGKRVGFTFNNGTDYEETIYFKSNYDTKSSLRSGIEWNDLFQLKWTIEADTP